MRIFLIAGEASGDRLGAALMEGLSDLLDDDVEFLGVGGPLMQAQGMESLFPMDELSVMGLAEVLPKYRQLKRRIAETAETALQAKPDVMISIDSPDFCLRVAKLVKAASDIRTVHYVAPSVWAWREGRATKMAKVIDHVLALLPFEPPLMEAAGMECNFVGHPVVSEPQASNVEATLFRAKHKLGQNKTLLVLPGSRRGEVSRLTPVFGAALQEIVQAEPDLKLVIPTTGNVTDLVREAVADWPVKPVILDPRGMEPEVYKLEKAAAFAAADAALAASGTVSLELAAAGTPMVIAYDMNWLSRILISRMLKVDTVTLVNLVSETRTVPEFIGKNCLPEKIAPAVVKVLGGARGQQEAMELTMQRLGRGGQRPGLRAAHAVLRGMGVQV
ncbi:lipid-A-disaccharide synthase [Thalassobius sp. MITS945101]|uniref:lipid-A-disaccharide synthase n=1 Tax=Thalassobius sp. MITS945101 TaxID=3096994 RepID=UPI00399A1512